MKYLLADGDFITASTNEEFIEELKEGSRFDYNLPTEEFLKSFINRINISYGEIKSDTLNDLIKELIRVGFMTIE